MPFLSHAIFLLIARILDYSTISFVCLCLQYLTWRLITKNPVQIFCSFPTSPHSILYLEKSNCLRLSPDIRLQGTQHPFPLLIFHSTLLIPMADQLSCCVLSSICWLSEHHQFLISITQNCSQHYIHFEPIIVIICFDSICFDSIIFFWGRPYADVAMHQQ